VVEGYLVETPTTQPPEVEPTAEDMYEAAKLASKVVNAFTQLGQNLANSHKNDVKAYLDEHLTVGNTSVFPSADTLSQLLQCSTLMDIPTYLEAFEDKMPYHVALDDSMVWPAPQWMYLPCIKALTQILESKDETKGPAQATPNAGGLVGSTSNLAQ
jgi:hypothetical protein